MTDHVSDVEMASSNRLFKAGTKFTSLLYRSKEVGLSSDVKLVEGTSVRLG